MARRIIQFLFFNCIAIAMIVNASCSKSTQPEDCTTYDYSDCNTLEPMNQNISMSFSINKYVKKVPYIVYKGYVDNGEELFRDTAEKINIDLLAEFNVYYSVKAEYIVDGKTIYAIDGGKLKKTKTTKCDSVCWDVQDESFDLLLH